MALASGPWGVEDRLCALCSAAVVLQIWVKYPAGTALTSGLDSPDSPEPKKSVFSPPPQPPDTIFILRWEQCTAAAAACRPEAGETPLGIRIIFLCKRNTTDRGYGSSGGGKKGNFCLSVTCG